MIRQSVTYYLAEESRLNEVSLNEIQQWSEEAPYSQHLKILLAKKMNALKSNKLTDTIAKVASMISNRVCLYRHLFSRKAIACATTVDSDIKAEEEVVHSNEIVSNSQDESLVKVSEVIDIDPIAIEEDTTQTSLEIDQTQDDDSLKVATIDRNIQHAVASIDHISLQSVSIPEESKHIPLVDRAATEENEILDLATDDIDHTDSMLDKTPAVSSNVSAMDSMLQARPEYFDTLRSNYIYDDSKLSNYTIWLSGKKNKSQKTDKQKVKSNNLEQNNTESNIVKAVKKLDKINSEKKKSKGNKKKKKSDKLKLEKPKNKKKKKQSKKKKLQETLQQSLILNSDIISEPWADLLAKQGHIKEASKMYKHLSLRYPEKSSYFAAKLKNLKKK